MSLAGGATTVGDIHGFGRSAQTLKALPIRKVLFFEVTGFSPERTQLGIERLQNHLRVAPSPDALFTISVSPHAPYSTSAALYRHCCGFRIADCFSFRNPKSEIRNRVPPLCTHLAETPDELEFLAHGTGAFADLLDTLQIPRQDWTPPGRTPVAYMQDLGVLAHRPLLAHCNYLTDADIQTLARSGATVVFCPRSHHYFYHTDHPIKRLLDAGVNVAIGTDSHASNWSLSMLDELRFLFNAYHTSLAPETLLALVTLNGAKGLGLKRVGKLRAGWQADLIAIRIPDDGRDWFERICDEASENVLTVVAGKICYDAAT